MSYVELHKAEHFDAIAHNFYLAFTARYGMAWSGTLEELATILDSHGAAPADSQDDSRDATVLEAMLAFPLMQAAVRLWSVVCAFRPDEAETVQASRIVDMLEALLGRYLCPWYAQPDRLGGDWAWDVVESARIAIKQGSEVRWNRAG